MRVRPENRRIGVLLSGRGSNFRAIADSIASGALDAEIGLVLSNRPESAGLAEARRRGFETVCIPSSKDRAAFDASLVAELGRRDVSLICLAGFMRILGSRFIQAFPQAILNIHPSLLPAFPGLDAQRQALDYGVRFTGCTVHFVDESLDGGPILSQAVVAIESGDTVETLSDRILAQEHRIYPEAIGLVLDGRCEPRDRQVIVHDD
jgi:phosphoribosylglycinamide formyltransferase-1